MLDWSAGSKPTSLEIYSPIFNRRSSENGHPQDFFAGRKEVGYVPRNKSSARALSCFTERYKLAAIHVKLRQNKLKPKCPFQPEIFL